jgi:hypothetical protein
MRVLYYLREHPDYGITIQAHNKADDTSRLGKVVGYVDADFAGDHDNRRSTTGILFMLANAPISWSSKLQPTVSMSTCEAEYTAIAAAGREAIWIMNVLKDMGFQGVEPMTIYTDSESAIKLSINQQFHARTKHIDVQSHWIREAIANGKIRLEYKRTSDMLADVLTKALGRVKFEEMIKALNMRP